MRRGWLLALVVGFAEGDGSANPPPGSTASGVAHLQLLDAVERLKAAYSIHRPT